MENGFAKRTANENMIIALLVIIAAGVIFVALMSVNIIPAARVASMRQPGATPVAPSPNRTQPPTGQQQVGSDMGAPVVNPVTSQQLGVKCPSDLCTSPSYGSPSSKCPGSGQTYYEQYCYRYPAYASSLLECDSRRACYLSKCGVDSGGC